MRVARLEGELTYNNNWLLMFPDYSVETQKLRRSFDSVKAAMRIKELKYSILFPSKLRVIDGEKVRFFTSPKDAAD